MATRFDKEWLAAKALRDEGISLPLRFTGRWKFRWVMRVPTMDSLARISRMYLRMGVRHADLQALTFEGKAEFMARHAKTVSRMVAYGIVRGFILGWLLNRPVAWALRKGMPPAALEEAFMVVAASISTVPFGPIIKLAETINVYAPRLSHEESGS
jgi:hypothetical protein